MFLPSSASVEKKTLKVIDTEAEHSWEKNFHLPDGPDLRHSKSLKRKKLIEPKPSNFSIVRPTPITFELLIGYLVFGAVDLGTSFQTL